MGRQWSVPERGEKERDQSREKRRKVGRGTTQRQLGSPQKREDLGWALWPCKICKFKKKWLVTLSVCCHLCSGWGKLPNNKGGSWNSRTLPSSLYKRWWRHTWSTSLRMQICVQYTQRGLHWLAHRIVGGHILIPPSLKKGWIYENECSYLGISYLYTQYNAGKNHILDGSGSGSAAVSQLEVLHPHPSTRIVVKFM